MQQLGSWQGFTVSGSRTLVKARWFLNGHLTSCYAAPLAFHVPVCTVFAGGLTSCTGSRAGSVPLAL